jgi:hypothetical protein
VPSRARNCECGGLAVVGLEAGEDGIADLPFQAAQGFFASFAFGSLAVVIGAAGAVAVADLADGGHVDGVVEPPVSAPLQPVDLALAGGHLDRGDAVASGEVIAAGEPGDVAAGAEDLGDGGPGRGDHCGEFGLVSRIWASMRRRSSVNAAASSPGRVRVSRHDQRVFRRHRTVAMA